MSGEGTDVLATFVRADVGFQEGRRAKDVKDWVLGVQKVFGVGRV